MVLRRTIGSWLAIVHLCWLEQTASAGLSAGTGQVYVVAHDNTVWAFGIPLAIN